MCHIPTSWHVKLVVSGIAMWQICCRIVVRLSVGGVRSRCPCSGVWLLTATSSSPYSRPTTVRRMAYVTRHNSTEHFSTATQPILALLQTKPRISTDSARSTAKQTRRIRQRMRPSERELDSIRDASAGAIYNSSVSASGKGTGYRLLSWGNRWRRRSGSSPKIQKFWGVALAHQSLHHRVHFIRSPKPKNTNPI